MTKRWLYLTLGVVGLLCIGVLYAWSIMKVPLAEEFGFSDATLATVYTISMIFFCIGSIVSGVLSKKISFQKLLLFGGILILCGFGLLSGMKQSSVLWMSIFYGVLVSLGIGIAYNVLISEVTAWFPDMRGLCSGILMMGFGASAMVIGQVVTPLFQGSEAGWRKVYFFFGILCFLVLLLCAILLHTPKRAAGAETPVDLKGLTAKETMQKPSFWIFYLYGAAGAAIGSTIISFARDFALNVGVSAAGAVLLVGVLSICNGVGRIICGFFYDRFGGRISVRMIALLTVCVPAILLGALASKSSLLLTIGFSLAGITYGSYPTVSASFISEEYGRKDFSINYSISNSKLLFSSFGATAAGMLLEKSGVYRPPLLMLLIFAVIALLLSFAIRCSNEASKG